MTVKVEHLTGGYGKKPVIKDLNFELEKGEIVGLIGLNGAGKSTTIKHMLGLINPMEGKLSISNIKINEDIENYAQQKLRKKNADVIISNNVGDMSIGFSSDDNELTMHFKNNEKVNIKKGKKVVLAAQILDELETRWQ